MIGLILLVLVITALVAHRLRRDLARATTWSYDMPCDWWTNGHGAHRTSEQIYRYDMPLPGDVMT